MNKIIPFIIIIVMALMVDLLIYINLPKQIQTVEEKPKKVIIKKQIIKKEINVIKKKIVKKEIIRDIDSDIKLNAIYIDNNDSWVLLSKKGFLKTSMINIGNSFNGYKLKTIFTTYAIFTRDKKEYKLYLNINKTEDKEFSSSNINETLYKNIIEVKKENINKVKENIIIKKNNIVKIDKKLIASYKNDFSKIWKEIDIKTIKKSGKINGFKINNISMKGIFNKLGLKKGDIIKSVNGSNLTNYLDAFRIYNNINRLKTINIGIQRDNKNMELKYEIK